MTIQGIEREIIRLEQKIESYKQKSRALKKRKVAEENAQIVRVVRASSLSIEELRRLLVHEQSSKEKEEKNV